MVSKVTSMIILELRPPALISTKWNHILRSKQQNSDKEPILTTVVAGIITFLFFQDIGTQCLFLTWNVPDIRVTEWKADGLENTSTVPILLVHFMQPLRQLEGNF